MSKFYFTLWLRWSIRLTLCSIILALMLSTFIGLYIYISQGMVPLNPEVFKALLQIELFWFPIVWSLTLLVALFRSLKYIFNIPIAGYQLKLYSCDLKDIIVDVGYGDLVKVWRRWFSLLIWLMSSLMILSLAYTYLFTSYTGVFEWFNIYWLFSFLLISGYFSFVFIGARCKRVRYEKC